MPHFLDKVPFDWSQKESSKLLKIFTQAYNDTIRAYHIVSLVQGFNSEFINFRNAPGYVWREIIEAASNQELLRVLINVILCDPTVAVHHSKLYQLLAGTYEDTHKRPLLPHTQKTVELDLQEAPQNESPDNKLSVPPKVSSNTSQFFAYRAEVTRQLKALLEPVQRVRFFVLQGISGVGKTELAKNLTEHFQETYQPLWLSFEQGPELGWAKLGEVLGSGSTNHALKKDDNGIPLWIKELHLKIMEGRYLLVVENVSSFPDEDLPLWLPSPSIGQGAVLILSQSPQKALQQSCEAIVVRLPPLSLEESRQLLSQKVPAYETNILLGEADTLIERVSGHPATLMGLVPMIKIHGLKQILDWISLETGGKLFILQGIRSILAHLDDSQKKTLEVIEICSPAGSPIILIRRLLEKLVGNSSAVDTLLERGLLLREGHKIRLMPLIRLGAEPKDYFQPFLEHTALTTELVKQARKTREPVLEAQLYEDLFLAVERIPQLNKLKDTYGFWTCTGAVLALSRYKRAENKTHQLVIDAYRAIIAIYTKEAFPYEWANAQTFLGAALERLSPKRNETLYQAIEAYQAALTVFTPEKDLEDWAESHLSLGFVITELPNIDQAMRQQAVDSFQSALYFFTPEKYPEEWAWAQSALGLLSAHSTSGDPTENLRQALNFYRAALGVFNRDKYPDDWAETQYELVRTLTQLPNRQENELLEAVNLLRELIEAQPHNKRRARLQIFLGGILLELSNQNKTKYLPQAKDAFQAVLTIVTQKESPVWCARAQANLGIVFAISSGTDNLQKAIELYYNSLTVLTLERFPKDWATTQLYLAQAWIALPIGERAENLKKARDAFYYALTVFTSENLPQVHEMTKESLANVLRELESIAQLADNGERTF
jgi:hypothetical protein